MPNMRRSKIYGGKKRPFKSITTRSTELLELIYTDLTDFRNNICRGDKTDIYKFTF